MEYDDLKIVLRDLGNVNKSLQISCDQILEAYPHLAHQVIPPPAPLACPAQL